MVLEERRRDRKGRLETRKNKRKEEEEEYVELVKRRGDGKEKRRWRKAKKENGKRLKRRTACQAKTKRSWGL